MVSIKNEDDWACRIQIKVSVFVCHCLVGKIVSSKVDGTRNVRIYDFLITERYVSINIFCEDLPTLVMSVYKSLRVEFVKISHVEVEVIAKSFQLFIQIPQRGSQCDNWLITIPAGSRKFSEPITSRSCNRFQRSAGTFYMWPASLKRGETRVSKSYDRFWKGFGVGVNWLR